MVNKTKTAAELANEHWNWVESLLYRQREMQREMEKKLFIDAFIHGHKHGVEDQIKKDGKNDK